MDNTCLTKRIKSIKKATNTMFQNKYAEVCVTAIALGITFFLWNKWNNRILSITQYVPKVKSAKARIICRHWLRKNLFSPEISSHCLVDIVLEYYPSSEMFEWDSRRKHRRLKLSNDGTRFTVGSSLFLKDKGHVAVASKQIFSSDTISFIRWKMTLVKSSQEPIRFSMGYVDASFIDGFDVNDYVGTLHQAALNVKDCCDVRDSRRAMKDGIWVPQHSDGLARLMYLRFYRMSPGDTFEMRFDFTASMVWVGGFDTLVSIELPHSIYLAASADGPGCSFETTLFECK